MEVQIKLHVWFIEEFVRLHFKIEVNRKIVRFVSITKGVREKEWYQVIK